jgi:hypothetical protein
VLKSAPQISQLAGPHDTRREAPREAMVGIG